mmetsp:Transcript_20748/g.64352  ORF Transcript_20748/g.64352 Transcript_20748/m.64352 type:complete len:309 (+) Transcript_20748:281-1207(+)
MVHGVGHEVGVLLGEAHRRLGAEHVAVDAALADEHAQVAQPLEDVRRLRRGRLLGGAIRHQLHAQHQPPAANVADNVVLVLELQQPLLEVPAHHGAILLQVLVVNGAQHRAPHRTDDWIAAIRVEVQALRKRLRNLGRGHHRRQREAVADALGHRHNVGDDAMVLEAPVVGARAPKARLHLVGDAQPAMLADELVRLGDKAVGVLDGAAHALDGLMEKGRHVPAGGRVDNVPHVAHVRVRVVAERAAVRVGVHRVVHALPLRNGVLPRVHGCHAHRGVRHAVVAVAQRHHVAVARVEARHQQRHVVRL